jgi:hypothetical protein
VYIISAQGSAVFQMIQFGETRGDEVEVLTGLKSGDTVVTDNKLGRIEGKKVVVAQK